MQGDADPRAVPKATVIHGKPLRPGRIPPLQQQTRDYEHNGALLAVGKEEVLGLGVEVLAGAGVDRRGYPATCKEDRLLEQYRRRLAPLALFQPPPLDHGSPGVAVFEEVVNVARPHGPGWKFKGTAALEVGHVRRRRARRERIGLCRLHVTARDVGEIHGSTVIHAVDGAWLRLIVTDTLLLWHRYIGQTGSIRRRTARRVSLLVDGGILVPEFAVGELRLRLS